MGGIPEVVQGGETGFLVPPGSPEVLAERLTKFIEDKDMRSNWARAAGAGMSNIYSGTDGSPNALKSILKRGRGSYG